MDDIKTKNNPIKIKVTHYNDKENEGSILKNLKFAEETVDSSNQADLDIDLNDIDLDNDVLEFKTPEQASQEDAITEPDIDESIEEDNNKKKPKKRRNPIKWFKSLNTKQKIVVGIIAFIILVIIAGGLYLIFKPNKMVAVSSPKKTIVVKKTAIPTTVPSTLTGLPVDPSVNKRPVTAVMIENSTYARPQSGLDTAGVVFEAIAEGGVTRFMAVYQDTQPDYIGPVRSARPYYIQWALGFDAAYAHVGGSPDALTDLSAWNVRNIDQFYNSSAFERISSRDAPHNVYTSISKLNSVEQAKDWTSSTYNGFPRKADSPSKNPNATAINLSLSGPVYDPSFTYNPKTNNYTRSEDGSVQTEISSSGTVTNITPKVVIAMVTPLSQGALDATGAYYSDYNVIGTGQVYIFQDGTVTTGTWTKNSNSSQITFSDANGNSIKLNAGQTWITAVGSASNVSYK